MGRTTGMMEAQHLKSQLHKLVMVGDLPQVNNFKVIEITIVYCIDKSVIMSK